MTDETLNNDLTKLRFLDENGENYPDWEEKHLKESLKIKNGKSHRYMSVSNGIIPVYGSNGIFGYSNDSLSNGPAIIYGRKGTIDKPKYSSSSFWASDTTLWGTPIESDCKFVYYLSQKIPFSKLATTSGLPSMTQKALEDYITNLPSLPEQAKIAEFLSNLDERIEQQSKLVEFLKEQKQGYSQRLFNGSLRFKKDDGTDYEDWEEKKLGELFTKYEEKIYVKDDIKYGQITVSKTGLITHRALNFGSNIGRKRQFMINLNKYPNTLTFIRQGIAEGGIGIVPNELNGYVVTENMPLLSFNENYIKKDYINQYIKSNLYYRDVLKDLIPNGSAQKAIHEKDWLNKISIFPSLPEQEKIVEFLSSLDNRIDEQLNKLEQLKSEKQAYMQKVLG